ncbi:hypothetical protein [Tuwongella immobilis]|uniref:Uncharacterized protein n=1 Tax=Tuwongella immobilis TaxID=692036 RepID=A0A6C2YN07_9BACT|nr:hypothetical protein [Tuwongella immobilis]VIP02764.1 unnamed protein product [Tuwongella immobilis]VTS02381.1 unnamed protein product [Tuwongella immobilis]
MQRYCVKCQRMFTGHMLCPRCGVQLVDPTLPVAIQPRLIKTKRPEIAQYPIWLRILLGTVLILLLSRGVNLLVMVCMNWVVRGWVTDDSLVRLVSEQVSLVVAVLFGALIAGTGHARGIQLGLLMGIIGAFLLHLMPLPITSPALSGQFMLGVESTVLGLIGGAVGRAVWKPFPAIDVPLIVLAPPEPVDRLAWIRTVPWLKLIPAVAASVWITLNAEAIRSWFFYLALSPDSRLSYLEIHFITWEIPTFALFLGAAWVASRTKRGVTNGLLVGGLVGVLVIFGYLTQGANKFDAFKVWLSALDSIGDDAPTLTPNLMLFILGSSLSAGLIGGWLGSELFLPRTAQVRIRVLD